MEAHFLSHKKIGVLGASGYIGRNLVAYLLKEENVEVIQLSRLNYKEQVFKESFDYFINCAGNTGDFREDVLGTIDSNISVTLFLLKNLKVKETYIGLSSTRVYGFSETENIEFSEEESINISNFHTLENVYDCSKLMVESMLMNTKTLYNTTILRLSNVYGNYTVSDLNDKTYLKYLLKRALNSQTVNFNQSSKTKKDYIHINEVVKGIIASLNSTGKNIYNIASGKSHSIVDWCNHLGLKYIEDIKQHKTKFSNISIQKAKKDLGFEVNRELTSIDKIIKI